MQTQLLYMLQCWPEDWSQYCMYTPRMQYGVRRADYEASNVRPIKVERAKYVLALPTERAWAAGFFDGEGCISAYRSSGKRRIRLNVKQKDCRPLIRFRDTIGFGPVILTERSDRGNFIHEYYLGSFERIQFAIALMWPWLSEPKREQAAVKLREFLANKKEARDGNHD